MLVKDHYRQVIQDIMKANGIPAPSFPPNHVIPSNATLRQVVRYTHWYLDKGDSQEHYRYSRYLRMLLHLTASKGQIAHVDVGSGAGVFSWVFLDWAIWRRIKLERVDLYGLDHCPAMIQLAKMVSNKLKQQIPNYPDLSYSHDVDALLSYLMKNHREGTDYVITFGHVLAQAHSCIDIRNFTRVIAYIRNNLMDSQSECYLVAVDARSGFIAFVTGWSLLLKSLESTGIRHEQDSPVIFDSTAKARIYPAQ